MATHLEVELEGAGVATWEAPEAAAAALLLLLLLLLQAVLTQLERRGAQE